MQRIFELEMRWRWLCVCGTQFNKDKNKLVTGFEIERCDQRPVG